MRSHKWVKDGNGRKPHVSEGKFFLLWSTNLISASFSSSRIVPPFFHRQISHAFLKAMYSCSTSINSLNHFRWGMLWDNQNCFPWKRGVTASFNTPLSPVVLVPVIIIVRSTARTFQVVDPQVYRNTLSRVHVFHAWGSPIKDKGCRWGAWLFNMKTSEFMRN